MKPTFYFDHAATTRCCDSAARELVRFATDDYGNPSSIHSAGVKASKAIRESRQFFADHFGVEPSQVVFTGSGTEADNMAVYGVALGKPVGSRVVTTAIEHPAVRKTALSLESFGIDTQFVGVDSHAQIKRDDFQKFITPKTVLVSVQQINNIVGAVLPVEEIAVLCKKLNPALVFHTDAIQAFGKVDLPRSGSAVDLVSISAHKINGPKGVGALVVLNKDLLKTLRPLVWGGGQEGGLRSGTQSPGLIAGFYAAARETLAKRAETATHVRGLQRHFKEKLLSLGLLHSDPARSLLRWNSPEAALPQVVSMSLLQLAPGKSAAKLPASAGGMLAQMLSERGFMISTGSACSSKKVEPDAVLTAMGLPPEVCTSSIRASFSALNTVAEVDLLAQAMQESITMMAQLL